MRAHPTSKQLNVLDTMILNNGTLATDAMRHMGVRGPLLAQLHRREWVYMICPGLWGITGEGRIAAAREEAQP